MVKHILLASTIIGGVAVSLPASSAPFAGSSTSLNAAISFPVTSDLMIQVKGGKHSGGHQSAKNSDDDDDQDADDNEDDDDQGDDNDDQGDDGDDDERKL